MDEPVQNPDPEQQRHDNRESRRQSGLDPEPGSSDPDATDAGESEREDEP